MLTRTQKYYYQEATVVPPEETDSAQENAGDTGTEENKDTAVKETPEETEESIVEPAKLIPIPVETEEETEADPSGEMTDKSDE